MPILIETMHHIIPNAQAMVSFGHQIARHCPVGKIIYLIGELGTGKTTLVTGFIRQLGYTGSVKSPTYTLIEPYTDLEKPTYHLDLYRLADPEELDYLGFRDYLTTQAICLIEWPEKGKGFIPNADIQITLRYHPQGRQVEIDSTLDKIKQIPLINR